MRDSTFEGAEYASVSSSAEASDRTIAAGLATNGDLWSVRTAAEDKTFVNRQRRLRIIGYKPEDPLGE